MPFFCLLCVLLVIAATFAVAEYIRLKSVKYTVILTVLLLILLWGGASFAPVPSGQIGVQSRFGQVLDEGVLNPGIHTVAPWNKVYKYKTYTRNVPDRKEGSDEVEYFVVHARTIDGQNVDINVSYTWAYDTKFITDVPKLFKEEAALEELLRLKIVASVQKFAALYTIEGLQRRIGESGKKYVYMRNAAEDYNAYLATDPLAKLKMPADVRAQIGDVEVKPLNLEDFIDAEAEESQHDRVERSFNEVLFSIATEELAGYPCISLKMVYVGDIAFATEYDALNEARSSVVGNYKILQNEIDEAISRGNSTIQEGVGEARQKFSTTSATVVSIQNDGQKRVNAITVNGMAKAEGYKLLSEQLAPNVLANTAIEAWAGQNSDLEQELNQENNSEDKGNSNIMPEVEAGHGKLPQKVKIIGNGANLLLAP